MLSCVVLWIGPCCAMGRAVLCYGLGRTVLLAWAVLRYGLLSKPCCGMLWEWAVLHYRLLLLLVI